jgi:hypothetical protein
MLPLAWTQLLEHVADNVTDSWLKHDCPGSASQAIYCHTSFHISKFAFPDLQKISLWEFCVAVSELQLLSIYHVTQFNSEKFVISNMMKKLST